MVDPVVSKAGEILAQRLRLRRAVELYGPGYVESRYDGVASPSHAGVVDVADGPGHRHPPTKPSGVYIDAQAVLEGAGAERMPKSSRRMGTRFALVRYAEDSGSVKLRKVRAEFNVADIVSKCLCRRGLRDQPGPHSHG